MAGFALALIAPVNHDESQYFAAAELAVTLRPFADFLYLQTPLQPLLTAPVAMLSDSYSFVSLRLATALMGFATVWLVYRCQRRLDVDRSIAFGTALLLLLTHSFQFGSTVVRNDALPALLLTGGMLAALMAIQLHPRGSIPLWGVAGLAFSLAASAKVSYAIPAAAVGLYHVLIIAWQPRRAHLTDAAACASGAALGIIPVLVFHMLAPDAFMLGTIHYANEAPFHWYQLNGFGDRLDMESKFTDTLLALLRGPAWIALAAVLLAITRRPRNASDRAGLLLVDLLVVAGIIAALLPTPTWKQYLVPLLPPLFVRFGLVLRDYPLEGLRARWARGVIVVAVLVGLGQPLVWMYRSAGEKQNPIEMTEEAHWIGERLRAAGANGEIATLSPQATLDSGYPLDPRFATGPFFYRSGDFVGEHQQRAMRLVSPATLAEFLAERPPAAIVTGYESRDHLDRQNLDEGLRRFARANGYRLVHSPHGDAELFIAPVRLDKQRH